MSEIYGTFSTAYVEAMRLRLSALEPENKGLAARVAELEAENKAMRDRVAELDTERQGAQSAIRRAYEAASAAIEMRAAGNALARHVAEDTRGQTARQLVQAWKEASQ
jgi:hypothetical protein